MLFRDRPVLPGHLFTQDSTFTVVCLARAHYRAERIEIASPRYVIIEFKSKIAPTKVRGCNRRTCKPPPHPCRPAVPLGGDSVDSRDGFHLNLVASLFRIKGENGESFIQSETIAPRCSKEAARMGGYLKVRLESKSSDVRAVSLKLILEGNITGLQKESCSLLDRKLQKLALKRPLENESDHAARRLS